MAILGDGERVPRAVTHPPKAEGAHPPSDAAESELQFTAMLDAPPDPNPGLERLMAVKAPWSTGAA